MASISLPTAAIIAASVSAAAAGVSAYESREQGIATQRMDRQKATVAKEQATQQQINMRQKMLAALATQNAQAGVGGIGTGRGTSFGANALRQIKQAQNDLLVNNANEAAQTSLLDAAGANAAAAGTAGAVGDVLQGTSSLFKSGVFSGSGAPSAGYTAAQNTIAAAGGTA